MPTYRLTFRDDRPPLTLDADFWRREGPCLTFYQSPVEFLTQRWIVASLRRTVTHARHSTSLRWTLRFEGPQQLGSSTSCASGRGRSGSR
jgi:hypothetical protein